MRLWWTTLGGSRYSRGWPHSSGRWLAGVDLHAYQVRWASTSFIPDVSDLSQLVDEQDEPGPSHPIDGRRMRCQDDEEDLRHDEPNRLNLLNNVGGWGGGQTIIRPPCTWARPGPTFMCIIVFAMIDFDTCIILRNFEIFERELR